MILKPLDHYYSHHLYPYTSPSYNNNYFNPIRRYQVTISCETSPDLFDSSIQQQYVEKTRSHKKRREHHSNASAKQSYQSISSLDRTLTSSDVHQVTNNQRFDLQNYMKQEQSTKKNSSSLHFQSFTNEDHSPRPALYSSIDDYYGALKDLSATPSNEELVHLLNRFTITLKHFDHVQQYQQQLSIVVDILNALLHLRPEVLTSASENEFFSTLLTIFIRVMGQLHQVSSLEDNEFLIFRIMTKLIEKQITSIHDVKLIPSWLTDSSLLEAISTFLSNTAMSKTLHDRNDKIVFKYLIRLIDAYILYQQQTDHKDALGQLLDSILYCLTSPHFIHLFTHVSIDARSMTTIEKFFLVKCPAFITSYNGSRLEQTMESLLSTMLPQYVQLLDQLVPSIHQWKRSMMRSVHHLLQVINHGATQFSTNAKLISGHLSLIDNVLRLVNEPILYNNLCETLSNVETTLMNTAISFLVNMIREPSILAHVKQSQVASRFLRLTTCSYEPLVLNVYALLAYTTHEEDIKAMHNPGRLLATIIQSLKIALSEKAEKKTQIEQLLETLKGLVQHDQIKDEIIKQNALPFLLACTKKLIRRALVLIFEILWCLTFFEEIADLLRADPEFLNRIQTISEDKSNEPLKKATDGLIWKLLQETASLEKVTLQEEMEESEVNEIVIATESTVGKNGKRKIVKTGKGPGTGSGEYSYRYDIMISYCHSDKELTYKIHKFLTDQGFKVWIDLDNMYGPAMSAMAEAVENSEFVLMCMSDSYKQSTYCQAEAEYAFKCKRRLIPLIMRQGYRPDGWLGFLIGSRLYIDFGRFDFDTACEKILMEISLQRRPTIPTTYINSLDHQHPTDFRPSGSRGARRNKKVFARSQMEQPTVRNSAITSVFKARQAKLDFLRKRINQWIESDVLDFLLAHRLNQLIPLCEGMDGRALIQLYRICISRRLRAYSVLKDELKLKNKSALSLTVYSQFLSVTEEAIKVLSTLLPPPPGTTNLLPQTLRTIPFTPAPDQDTSYDFSITTNASPLDTLKMVEQFGSQLEILDSLRRRISGIF